jgi:hypothetical protein
MDLLRKLISLPFYAAASFVGIIYLVFRYISDSFMELGDIINRYDRVRPDDERNPYKR